jgi:hypothetical protein
VSVDCRKEKTSAGTRCPQRVAKTTAALPPDTPEVGDLFIIVFKEDDPPNYEWTPAFARGYGVASK